jgi:hypothetical protein
MRNDRIKVGSAQHCRVTRDLRRAPCATEPASDMLAEATIVFSFDVISGVVACAFAARLMNKSSKQNCKKTLCQASFSCIMW